MYASTVYKYIYFTARRDGAERSRCRPALEKLDHAAPRSHIPLRLRRRRASDRRRAFAHCAPRAHTREAARLESGYSSARRHYSRIETYD